MSPPIVPFTPAPSTSRITTAHLNFLQPATPTAGDLPTSLVLRGVNLGSTGKIPTFPLESYESLPTDTREQRDELRRRQAGVVTQLDDAQGGIWSEGEQGGREGWFVGHPLREEEADLHLRRMKAWGFRLIRFIVPWEALEHAGPGKYDEAYIDYLIRILRRIKDMDLKVFISPHQDVYSRFTGGSGAPYWSIEALGINPKRVHQTGAAVLHGCWKNGGYGGEEGIEMAKNGEAGDFPDMIWNTNLHRLAARHCFTMYWASERFAPKCTINGKAAGQFVADCRHDAYGHLAARIREAGGLYDDCIIGWDSMNEPHEGFIGIPDLNEIPPSQDFRKGPMPTPLQAFLLGAGHRVDNIALDDFTSTGKKSKGTITLTPPNAEAVWLTRAEAKDAESRWGYRWGEEWNFWDEDGRGGCPWVGHGVWDPHTKEIIKKDYFNPEIQSGKKFDFITDFWRPAYGAFISRIRKEHPEAISFVNPPVFGQPPDIHNYEGEEGRVALSPHFYDGLTMLGKRRHLFNADAVQIQRGIKSIATSLNLGSNSIRKSLREQISELKLDAQRTESIGADDPRNKYPAVVGEIGTPFDMKETKFFGLAKGKTAFKDYREPTKAMDEILSACDGRNALSWTLWAYEPLNTHDGGDGWNGEDLSIWCYDDLDGDEDLKADAPTDLATLVHMGARGIQSWCRPYPAEVTGQVKEFNFDMSTSAFDLKIEIPESWRIVLNIPSKPSTLVDGDPKVRAEGRALIYVPYVHYVASSGATLQNGGDKDKREPSRRVLGEPDDAVWEEQDVVGAKVDIDLELSHGRAVIKGQWMEWFYPAEVGKVWMKMRRWDGVREKV